LMVHTARMHEKRAMSPAGTAARIAMKGAVRDASHGPQSS
jgi:hypothetical protein